MQTHLHKIESRHVILAVALLIGILLIAYGHWGSHTVAFYAGLGIVAGGVITGTLKLAVRGF